jgi:hypothetical protein
MTNRSDLPVTRGVLAKRQALEALGSEVQRTPLIRKLLIRKANYPDRLDPSGKFVDNSTELTCFEITGYPIKNSTVLWLVELQIRRRRKV